MRLVIEIVSGPHAGKRVAVEPGQVVRFGRAGAVEFATGDTYMSREHFAVECGTEQCRVQDLNSRNGTLLNGETLSSGVLRDGDRIFAGQTDFVARLEASAPARAATTPLQQQQRQAAAVPESYPPSGGGTSARPPSRDQFVPTEDAGAEQRAGRAPRPSRSEPPPPPPPPPRGPQADPGTVPFKNQSAGGEASRMPAEVRKVLEEAAASTPKGRLLKILREEPETLYALVDALNEPQMLELLRGSREEYQPLYESGNHPPEKIPYLVRLPPQSPLLERLVEHGWGKNWGVFLASRASLGELRHYFRQSLMVKTGDGREFFFRFYEPRFLRDMLRSSSYADAVKFFGPASTYFIEAEKPEILLQFDRTAHEIERRERLLLLSGT